MAINQFKLLNQALFVGLSTDTKPSGASPGDTFLETDTGNQFLYNGAWVLNSPTRFNRDLPALLTLAAQGAGTVNSAAQSNQYGKGVIVGINTTIDAAGSYLVNIQGQDVASGVWYTIASTAAIVSAVFQQLTVYPGIPVLANVTINAALPRTWRVQAVVTTGPITATIGASVIV
jgi:hypothetical protein